MTSSGAIPGMLSIRDAMPFRCTRKTSVWPSTCHAPEISCSWVLDSSEKSMLVKCPLPMNVSTRVVLGPCGFDIVHEPIIGFTLEGRTVPLLVRRSPMENTKIKELTKSTLTTSQPQPEFRGLLRSLCMAVPAIKHAMQRVASGGFSSDLVFVRSLFVQQISGGRHVRKWGNSNRSQVGALIYALGREEN